jgi:hypothetical protein
LALRVSNRTLAITEASAFLDGLNRPEVGLCWRIQVAGSLGQPGESGGPASGRYGPGEPGVEADEVEGHGGEGVLEEGLRLAAVAGVVEVAEPGGLGDQALDAASECVALAPVAGGLLGPDPLLGLLLTARQEGHVPGVVL